MQTLVTLKVFEPGKYLKYVASHFEFTYIDLLCDECLIWVLVAKIDFLVCKQFPDINLPDVMLSNPFTFPNLFRDSNSVFLFS